MTGHSSSFSLDANPGLIDRFEQMMKAKSSYFFDVEEIEFLADHYLDFGNHDKASVAIRHGLSIHPKSSSLLLKEAHALLFTNKAERALEILNYLEAAEPNNTEMLLFKAVVHRNLSDHEGTKACLVKALNASPDNKEEIFLDLAFEQEMVEDYDGAIESLKQSLEINPNHDASLFELGYCFDLAENIEGGVAYFSEYLDRCPYSFVGWYNLALCYEKMGFFEMAIETVGFAIAIKPDFTNAYILKGNMYTSCDMDFQAIDAYTESLEFDERNPLTYAAIGECYERLSNWDAAKLNYQKALDIDPNYIDALMGMGALKEAANSHELALTFYKKALDIDNLNIDFWHIYAEALVHLEKWDEAESAYKHITRFFGDDEDGWISLAKVQAKTKGSEVATKTLQTGKDIINTVGDIDLHLVKYLIEDGKIVQGLDILSNALINNEDSGKNFLTLFPEAIQIPNIADLIEHHTKENS